MQRKFRWLLIASAALLTACSSGIAPPSSTDEVLRLEASGEQIFRCARDSQGWYWKFQSPNAYLFDPVTNQAVAKHGYNFAFAHNDGSALSARIKSIETKPGELSEALFVTQSNHVSGAFSGVRYVQRINTHGGMPKSRCVEAQKDKYLRIPFTAEFVFYK